MAVVFGPLAIVILACCCAMAGFCSSAMKTVSECCDLSWSLFWLFVGIKPLIALWIWGIIAIANKPLAPWTDWQGNAITMCSN